MKNVSNTFLFVSYIIFISYFIKHDTLTNTVKCIHAIYLQIHITAKSIFFI